MELRPLRVCESVTECGRDSVTVTDIRSGRAWTPEMMAAAAEEREWTALLAEEPEGVSWRMWAVPAALLAMPFVIIVARLAFGGL